jgi:hypothetical protein
MPGMLERTLRRIALGDETILAAAHDPAFVTIGTGDEQIRTAGRLGALFALEPAASVLQQAVSDALLAGISRNQVGMLLVSALPIIGMARAAAVAPALGLALGYDLDEDLEGAGATPRPPR